MHIWNVLHASLSGASAGSYLQNNFPGCKSPLSQGNLLAIDFIYKASIF